MRTADSVRSPSLYARRPAQPSDPSDAVVQVESLPQVAGLAPIEIAERFLDLPGLALLESARPGRNARWSFLGADPLAVVDTPSTPGLFDVPRALLARLPPQPAPGLPFAGGLIGYLGYDLGRRLERLPSIAANDQDLPELRLALHDWIIAWDHRTGTAWLAGRALDGDGERLARRLADVRERLDGLHAAAGSGGGPTSAGLGWPGSPLATGPGTDGLRLDSGLDRQSYERVVTRIRREIARGQLYQANVARRLEAPFAGDPWALYRRLRAGDAARFSAFLSLGTLHAGGPRAIVSASPEPFLRVTPAGRVITDPIKGTRSRGRSRAEERALACELLASDKDRAENTMIVDVLRNDLGRVCRPGSVRVPRLCRLERAGSVQHLVSTVTGELMPGRDPFDLLASSFPGGSITGAPKIRAMELIEAVEPVRRGPYTGAAGWIGPDSAMALSILIRTFVADGRRLTFHVGGGITWRSDPAAEWAETVAKARGPLTAIGAVEAG